MATDLEEVNGQLRDRVCQLEDELRVSEHNLEMREEELVTVKRQLAFFKDGQDDEYTERISYLDASLYDVHVNIEENSVAFEESREQAAEHKEAFHQTTTELGKATERVRAMKESNDSYMTELLESGVQQHDIEDLDSQLAEMNGYKDAYSVLQREIEEVRSLLQKAEDEIESRNDDWLKLTSSFIQDAIYKGGSFVDFEGLRILIETLHLDADSFSIAKATIKPPSEVNSAQSVGIIHHYSRGLINSIEKLPKLSVTVMLTQEGIVPGEIDDLADILYIHGILDVICGIPVEELEKYVPFWYYHLTTQIEADETQQDGLRILIALDLLTRLYVIMPVAQPPSSWFLNCCVRLSRQNAILTAAIERLLRAMMQRLSILEWPKKLIRLLEGSMYLESSFVEQLFVIWSTINRPAIYNGLIMVQLDSVSRSTKMTVIRVIEGSENVKMPQLVLVEDLKTKTVMLIRHELQFELSEDFDSADLVFWKDDGDRFELDTIGSNFFGDELTPIRRKRYMDWLRDEQW